MVRQKAEVQTQRFKSGLTAGAPVLTEAGGSQECDFIRSRKRGGLVSTGCRWQAQADKAADY